MASTPSVDAKNPPPITLEYKPGGGIVLTGYPPAEKPMWQKVLTAAFVVVLCLCVVVIGVVVWRKKQSSASVMQFQMQRPA